MVKKYNWNEKFEKLFIDFDNNESKLIKVK